jgi:hypothetical protein
MGHLMEDDGVDDDDECEDGFEHVKQYIKKLVRTSQL